MAPQRFEKIESAPGNGMGSEVSNLQDVVHGCAANRPRLHISGVQSRLGSQKGRPAQEYEGKFSASQALEITQSREGISKSSVLISPNPACGEVEREIFHRASP
jgi:hypothetical protein